ncbi:MAG: amidase [Bradyrhizobium sp.]|uniref:acetamidase/formamidase family protein n=1 Tax=Bradyrhizobium sp. TaxID=376 RepID=UPI00122289A8|nr:acetamidase/formamidase family protein [Bradyrhizobium sp.]THD50463.1 MAG: amidase [Bradyrhizobium sp.]
MTSSTLPSRIAPGACGALILGATIFGTTALAQTSPPSAPAAASQFPPTATITTPGYPGVGPADFKLRVVNLPNGKKMHLLPATLDTTQWGWFDNAQPPVLRVNSGDIVVLETMMHSHNQVVPGTTIEQIKKTRTDFPGRGPHTLTGPIYIEEAQPGDVLKVTLNKIVPRAYATNFNVPGMFGEFPTLYPDGQVKYVYLDLDKMTTEFLPGVVIPLKPFPGTLAVARKEPGRYSSVPPGEFAGNMDIRDFVAGSSLYVPVYVPGALLWTGDSHAGQGNGEVNLTALETAYKEFNITVEVIKGKPLDFPRIETKKSWISMGFDQDLNKAWAQAKAQTVKLLAELRGVSAEQAEKLMPTVSDCRVSQVVNVKKGIHCLSSKTPREAEDLERPTKETSKYLVSHAKDADLNKAMDNASMGMIKMLETERKIARLDAYGLASAAMDCRIGAISDAEKNVHCLMPKSLWVKQ